MTVEKNFSCGIKCPVPLAKIFRFPSDPNHIYNSRRSVPMQGRIAIVTDAGWNAGGASGATDERADLRTAKSCGPDPSMVGVKSLVRKLPRADGDKKSPSPGRVR